MTCATRVIGVVPSLKSGGGVLGVTSLLEGIRDQGYQVRLFEAGKADEPQEVKLPLSERRTYTAFRSPLFRLTIGTILVMVGLIVRRRYAVALVTDPVQCILFALLRIFGVSQVRYVQADDVNIYNDRLPSWAASLYKALCKFSLQQYRRIFFNSEFSRKSIVCFTHKSATTAVIAPPIRHGLFQTPPTRGGVGSTIAIGTILRSAPLKRSDVFYAFAAAVADRLGDGVKLIALDPDRICPACSDIECRVATTEREVVRFYDDIDYFVGTSAWEGLGLPPIEAMARGAIAVLSDIPGNREYAVNGVNCLLYPVGEVSAIVAAVEIVSRDQDLQKKLRRHGHITAQHFSIPEVTTRFLVQMRHWRLVCDTPTTAANDRSKKC